MPSSSRLKGTVRVFFPSTIVRVPCPALTTGFAKWFHSICNWPSFSETDREIGSTVDDRTKYRTPPMISAMTTTAHSTSQGHLRLGAGEGKNSGASIDG